MRRAGIRAADAAVAVGGTLAIVSIGLAFNWSVILWGVAIAGAGAGIGSVLRREGVE